MDRPILSVIAELAAPQDGCVSAGQLRAAGISEPRARSLQTRGAMRRVTEGIYVVGAAELTSAAVLRAGVLRGGNGAAPGARTALERRSILKSDGRNRVTIWVPRSSRKERLELTTELPIAGTESLASIELVPSRLLDLAEVVNGMLTAGVADALVALAAAAVVPRDAKREQRIAAAAARRDCRKAWNEADFLGLLTRESVREAVRRRRGGAALVAELERESPLVGASAKLLSRAERRLLAGLVRRGMEPPCVNGKVEIGGRIEYPDFLYFLEQLALEVDGAGHDRPGRQVKDVARAERLLRQGIKTLRFADQEVWRDLERCLDEVESALRQRRSALA